MPGRERASEKGLARGEGLSEPLKFLAPPNGPRYMVIVATGTGINDSTVCGQVISQVGVPPLPPSWPV